MSSLCTRRAISHPPGARIVSYINNLHPKYFRPLYSTIERILDLAIPLCNMTLTPLKGSNEPPLRIPFTGPTYDPDPEDMPEEEKLQPGPDQDEDDEEFCERFDEWMKEKREEALVYPEPGEFVPFEVKMEDRVDLKRDFGARGLQVIVKLANIHLTPGKPSYEGGSWHVEGQLNEHICATAVRPHLPSSPPRSKLTCDQDILLR